MSFFKNRAILIRHGVVAHLGERIAGSDEVESSSLFGSTIYKAGLSWFCFLFFGMHENNLFFFTVCIS